MRKIKSTANPCQVQGTAQQQPSGVVVSTKRKKALLFFIVILPSLIMILCCVKIAKVKKKAKPKSVASPAIEIKTTYRLETEHVDNVHQEEEQKSDEEIKQRKPTFPAQKITPEMQHEMQDLRDAGIAVREIAIRYNVGVSTVYAKTRK